jgi:pyruvate kinase
MSNTVFKRTKILATIGPATFSQEKVFQLLNAGVNGIRMNFSHGDNDSRLEQIGWVREASRRLGKPVAILQDLQGPKIRLGIIKDNMLTVKTGDMLVLDSEIAEHDGSFNLPVQYNLAEKSSHHHATKPLCVPKITPHPCHQDAFSWHWCHGKTY